MKIRQGFVSNSSSSSYIVSKNKLDKNQKQAFRFWLKANTNGDIEYLETNNLFFVEANHWYMSEFLEGLNLNNDYYTKFHEMYFIDDLAYIGVENEDDFLAKVLFYLVEKSYNEESLIWAINEIKKYIKDIK